MMQPLFYASTAIPRIIPYPIWRVAGSFILVRVNAVLDIYYGCDRLGCYRRLTFQ